MKNSKKKTKQI